MRNSFPGICYRCGLMVEAGDGHFERLPTKGVGIKWRVQHASCALRWRGLPTPTTEHARSVREDYVAKQRRKSGRKPARRQPEMVA
jgi:hypothetical protein